MKNVLGRKIFGEGKSDESYIGKEESREVRMEYSIFR